MHNPSIGQMVHFVMADGVAVRPAIIVWVWSYFVVNLMVFTDGPNDDRLLVGGERSILPTSTADGKRTDCLIWRSSVSYLETNQPGTWHWPPRV
jgi:hypothetical protein